VEGIRDIEEVRARETVALNIDKRRVEREESMARRLERENARRAALELEPLASMEELEDAEVPDVQLDEAAAIVADMAELRAIAAAPTHTARIAQ